MKNKLLEIIKKEIIKETKKIINNAKVTARENKLDNIDKLLLINNNIELYLDSLKEYFIFDDDLINKISVLKNESIIEAKKDICNVILNIIKNEQKDVFIKIIDYINTLKSKGIDIDINSIENSIYKPINLDMQFLEYNQVFGINKLDIIKKYGTKCELTDFAILLGSIVSEDNKTGWWWIKNYAGYGDAKVVCYEGNCYSFPVNIDSICIRPVIKYSSIEKYCTNKILQGELNSSSEGIFVYQIYICSVT